MHYDSILKKEIKEFIRCTRVYKYTVYLLTLSLKLKPKSSKQRIGMEIKENMSIK